jgi:hypothetical protein
VAPGVKAVGADANPERPERGSGDLPTISANDHPTH